MGNEALQSLKSKSLADSIIGLRVEQEKLRADRKRVQKDLKNAQRRKRRLKGKARQLTNTDLLEVLLMRQADKESRRRRKVRGQKKLMRRRRRSRLLSRQAPSRELPNGQRRAFCRGDRCEAAAG